MLRLASHQLARASSRSVQPATRVAGRRFASSGAAKPRSWKNFAARLGLAGGAVYLYNTNNAVTPHPIIPSNTQPEQNEPETLRSVEDISAERRKRNAEVQKADAPPPSDSDSERTAVAGATGAVEEVAGGIEGLEEEAGQQGAFNEETGEINWDCPCLGGMADGPCGENFKAAFSCFVYSNEEPKGVDCIDKFKNMQDCFRQYPDIYGAELEDDEELEGIEMGEKEAAAAGAAVEPPELAAMDVAGGVKPPKNDADVVGAVAARTDATNDVNPPQAPARESAEKGPAESARDEDPKGVTPGEPDATTDAQK
ncbi:hypothetical protein P152DRAFT_437549 [Eremomyces bilateralis CBS 781.70]|uniref:Mitochondrial intermembrane space import and assembly protein 40 n=1 Tax=Eremomyces bilateralis CBS 781.70 TaxID=1392243 RepID=A0A6G1G1G6_9PEZI|nr:uncharacterized protein P152DRAFT_437549 [Eremomyces bilateralis CBS 781.70]KAF1811771.1 hypothetical protein P152DRAFT_437549 [Eremomyces bilateralis CBS 781.70]